MNKNVAILWHNKIHRLGTSKRNIDRQKNRKYTLKHGKLGEGPLHLWFSLFHSSKHSVLHTVDIQICI